MISAIFSKAWQVYREHFGVIAAVVIVVWLPCELISNYLDAFVFGPNDWQDSWRATRFFDNIFGIIAIAGVTFVALTAQTGQRASLGEAIGAGFSNWGRLWWTRFLMGLILLVSFLCLVLPGVYVLTRLIFVESIVVTEGAYGSEAIQRSFELTHKRFWQTFGFGLLLLAMLFLLGVLIALPSALLSRFDPKLGYWLIHAAGALVNDVISSFGTVALFCGYEAYDAESQAENSPTTASQPPQAETKWDY